jgi:hypothetical protein
MPSQVIKKESEEIIELSGYQPSPDSKAPTARERPTKPSKVNTKT